MKIKKGIAVGPEICKLTLNNAFDQTISNSEPNAWKNFKQICENFSHVKCSSKNEKLVIFLPRFPVNFPAVNINCGRKEVIIFKRV